MPMYLDPKNDLVFRKIFGEHPHLLKSFLNSVLPLKADQEIVELFYLPPEQIPQIPTLKRTIVDVKCKDQAGRVFIVEMQIDWTPGFMQRMLFNTGHAYIRQLNKGERYDSLHPVYGLGLLNSTFDPDKTHWYHHYQMVDVLDRSKKLEGLELIFIELPKFKPRDAGEKRLRALWLRFLSELHDSSTEVSSDLLEIPEIHEAADLAEIAAYTAGELDYYDRYWDSVSTEKTLLYGKYKMGLEKGLEQGKEEGISEGIKKMAMRLIQDGFMLEKVGELTALSLEELKHLV